MVTGSHIKQKSQEPGVTNCYNRNHTPPFTKHTQNYIKYHSVKLILWKIQYNRPPNVMCKGDFIMMEVNANPTERCINFIFNGRHLVIFFDSKVTLHHPRRIYVIFHTHYSPQNSISQVQHKTLYSTLSGSSTALVYHIINNSAHQSGLARCSLACSKQIFRIKISSISRSTEMLSKTTRRSTPTVSRAI